LSICWLLAACGSDGEGVGTTRGCDPLGSAVVADGRTDNTVAIQNAIDSCAMSGGGQVRLGLAGAAAGAVYVTGPIQLKSHVHLIIDGGVTLQAIATHSRYEPAFINWVYRPNEALISAKGATDVGISGSGTIDGGGDLPDPQDGGRTWHDVGAADSPTLKSTRPWVIEFYQCDHVTITGVTIQNQPYWVQALRYSRDILESGVTINGIGRNSDGVDLVGVTNATITNMDIRDSDDYIAVKSGLPISPNDYYYEREIGLPEMPTSHVRISNITARDGQGISIGSEAVNGVHDVVIENVTISNTHGGFRIKTGRDRGGDIYDIHVKNFVANGGDTPLEIYSYYSALGDDAGGPIFPVTPLTPRVHDIYIQDFAANDTGGRSYIRGLPEACIRNVVLNDVNIQSNGYGFELLNVTGAFTNLVVTADLPPTYTVKQNVNVTSFGTTPPFEHTAPRMGEPACEETGH